ncbi:MAG: hypothetical protein JWQ58_3827 [Reyranella sp.]|nr:hypothetical protein [Reyranella sp.]
MNNSTALLLAVVLGGTAACSQASPPPPPIAATQRAQFSDVAASPDAPEGLNEALAGIDANEKRRGCQQNVARVAADMRARGAVTQVTTAAGGMGGIAGRKAAKAVAVAQGRVVQAQVRQLPNCDLSAKHTAPSSEQQSGHKQ